jgi:hypothetical protein
MDAKPSQLLEKVTHDRLGQAHLLSTRQKATAASSCAIVPRVYHCAAIRLGDTSGVVNSRNLVPPRRQDARQHMIGVGDNGRSSRTDTVRRFFPFARSRSLSPVWLSLAGRSLAFGARCRASSAIKRGTAGTPRSRDSTASRESIRGSCRIGSHKHTTRNPRRSRVPTPWVS